MTRKDYEMVATSLMAARPDPATVKASFGAFGADSAIDTVARRLATQFAGDNPRFDPARFLRACGVK